MRLRPRAGQGVPGLRLPTRGRRFPGAEGPGPSAETRLGCHPPGVHRRPARPPGGLHRGGHARSLGKRPKAAPVAPSSPVVQADPSPPARRADCRAAPRPCRPPPPGSRSRAESRSAEAAEGGRCPGCAATERCASLRQSSHPRTSRTTSSTRGERPPTTSRAAFVAWMRAHTDQKEKFLVQKWDLAQVILKTKSITHPRILEAFLRAPREYFCRDTRRAYENAVLPIGYGQTISGPHMVARMTDYLDPQPEQKVLEIGTGSGYQSAVLSELSNHVYTIEIVASAGAGDGRDLPQARRRSIPSTATSSARSTTATTGGPSTRRSTGSSSPAASTMCPPSSCASSPRRGSWSSPSARRRARRSCASPSTWPPTAR